VGGEGDEKDCLFSFSLPLSPLVNPLLAKAQLSRHLFVFIKASSELKLGNCETLRIVTANADILPILKT